MIEYWTTNLSADGLSSHLAVEKAEQAYSDCFNFTLPRHPIDIPGPLPFALGMSMKSSQGGDDSRVETWDLSGAYVRPATFKWLTTEHMECEHSVCKS
jgi:hypothetical protein